MEIISYDKKYKKDFIEMNLSWINEMFKVEENDIKTLNSIEEQIQNGSMILFALDDKLNAISTILITKKSESLYEIEKFATSKKYRSNGAGAMILDYAINYVKNKGGKKIILVTNTKCEAAIHLYLKKGFYEIPVDKKIFPYERGNIAFEMIL